jgi:hypothetical protein
MVHSPLEQVPGRTGKGVSGGVIAKGLLGKDTPLPSRTPLGLFKGRNMGLDASLMTKQKIIDLSIPAISYHCFNRAASCLFMDLNHLGQKIPFISRTRSNGSSGDDLTVRINRSMRLVP